MKKRLGIVIKNVIKGSAFFKGGVRAEDRIVSINGNCIRDELDFQFFSSEHILEISVIRAGEKRDLTVIRQDGVASGVTLHEAPIHQCANHCIFCFVDQLPSGLRKSLYVKDEDLRLSLMNGNYVTMSGFKTRDLEQIVRLGISPLYISVHVTDLQIRRTMLGNRHAPDIIKQLQMLASNDIYFHTQIVVCQGYNDGEILKDTINDLLYFGDALQSIAVVPVGLTRFHKKNLTSLNASAAKEICSIVNDIGDSAAVKDGYRKVFCADELFIRASLPIPGDKYYENYPQLENGIGLVRQLFELCRNADKKIIILKKERMRSKRLIVTSVSAAPFIKKAIDMLSYSELFDTFPVSNSYFGTNVTVAGLLTGQDIIKQIKESCTYSTYEEVLIPDIVFNYAGYTLDGYSAKRISKYIEKPVRVVENILEIIE